MIPFSRLNVNHLPGRFKNKKFLSYLGKDATSYVRAPPYPPGVGPAALLPYDATALTRERPRRAKPLREIGMKHTNDSNDSNQQGHGSKANQATWQAKLAALRPNYTAEGKQGDGVSFRRSDNAFDAASENRFTYGKAKARQWDFDATQGARPPAPSRVERKDKREDGKWALQFTPKVEQPCYPAALRSSDITAVSKGNRVTKRFRVDTVDSVTGEDTSLLVTLVTNEIHILCYGKHFVFSKSNRSSATFTDGRDGKRRPLSFAKFELIRMLGLTEGLSKYAELITLPPKNPTTGKPTTENTADAQAGSRVAGKQAS